MGDNRIDDQLDIGVLDSDVRKNYVMSIGSDKNRQSKPRLSDEKSDSDNYAEDIEYSEEEKGTKLFILFLKRLILLLEIGEFQKDVKNIHEKMRTEKEEKLIKTNQAYLEMKERKNQEEGLAVDLETEEKEREIHRKMLSGGGHDSSKDYASAEMGIVSPRGAVEYTDDEEEEGEEGEREGEGDIDDNAYNAQYEGHYDPEFDDEDEDQELDVFNQHQPLQQHEDIHQFHHHPQQQQHQDDVQGTDSDQYPE
jgi:hypothetical protein